MLSSGDTCQLTDVLKGLPCRVAIPDWYPSLIGQRGAVTAFPDERRRFIRFNYAVKAVMECLSNLPTVPRPAERHLVLCKDLSRSGIGFLHAEPLYPLEEITLWLPTGRRKYVVRRCRRLLERCYEIGAQ